MTLSQKRLEITRRSRARHIDRARTASREWARRDYAADPKKWITRSKNYYALHADERRRYAREFNAKHREILRAREAAYREANSVKRREWQRQRKIRERQAAGTHSPEQWLEKCALLGNVCIYCGEIKRLTRDHKIPLTRRGTDDIANVVPACAQCNARKGTLTAQEFLSR